MNSGDKHGVLFDLDGTLLHTAPDLVGALNDMRVETGQAPLPFEELAKYCSFGGRGMLGRGLDLAPGDPNYAQAYTQFIDHYRNRMTCETHPYAGIRELVKQIVDAGMLWGIVTNKAEALTLPLLEHTHFNPAPACIIGGDTAHAPKPDPAPLNLACERLGIAGERCIYVGDSDRDISAGRAAGMQTIAVSYGYIPDDSPVEGWQADAIVHAPGEIWSAIQQLI